MSYQYSGIVGREVLSDNSYRYHSLLLIDRGNNKPWIIYKPNQSVAHYTMFNTARAHNLTWLKAAKEQDWGAVISKVILTCPDRTLSEEEFTRMRFFWSSDTNTADLSHISLEFSGGDRDQPSPSESRANTIELHDDNGKLPDPLQLQAETYTAYWRKLPENWSYIDTYRVDVLFPLNDSRLTHARKKLLVPGTRTGGKSFYKDIKEAHATLSQWLADNEDQAND